MRKLLTLLLAMLLVCSCSTMRAPAKLDRLVDRVERHADRYTLSDWQRVGRKYDELVKDMPKQSGKVKLVLLGVIDV